MNEPDFSRKIRLRQSERNIVLQLHAKFRKDPMTGFQEKLRTDGRTDERTDGQGSIYRTNLLCRWVQKEKFLIMLFIPAEQSEPNQRGFILTQTSWKLPSITS